VLGERLLGSEGTGFLEATEKAPIRSVVWMTALQKSLGELPVENRSPYHDEFVRRMNYVLTNTKPVALAELTKHESTPANAEAAGRLREYINGVKP
jgi:hypothetical protein